jgi:hypothetical protein
VVDLSAVVEADDRDDLMCIFVRSKLLTQFAKHFMEQHRMTPDAPKNLSDLEDYDEVVQRWLNDLTPAQRLEGLSPHDRLAGLSTQDLLLALPDEILRALPDDVLKPLPPQAQEAIRRRIGRPA